MRLAGALGKRPSLADIDITGANQLHRSIIEHQPERAVRLETGKAAADSLFAGDMDCQPSAREMCPSKPRLCERFGR